MKKCIALAISSIAITLVLADRFAVSIGKNLTNVGSVGITMGMVILVASFLGLHWATKK